MIIESEIPIILSADDNYAPYLGVTIKSLIEHSSQENEYLLFILDGGISNANKKRICSLATGNVKIKFIDILSHIANFDKKIFYTHAHFSVAGYFRFFIPEIFNNFKKVLYIDCDIIFFNDIAELFNIDIQDYLLGAAIDVDTQRALYLEQEFYMEYCSKKLNMNNPYNYFNTGVLIMNIPKLIEFDFQKKCINKLEELKNPICIDQCVINSLCEGQVKFLSLSWNVSNQLMLKDCDLEKELPPKIYEEYYSAVTHPKCLHFTSDIKPWSNPEIYNAELFWESARKTPFYEVILYKNIHNYIKQKEVTPPPQEITYSNVFQRIFSVKNLKANNKKYKIITLLGIKIKHKIADIEEAPNM